MALNTVDLIEWAPQKHSSTDPRAASSQLDIKEQKSASEIFVPVSLNSGGTRMTKLWRETMAAAKTPFARDRRNCGDEEN